MNLDRLLQDRLLAVSWLLLMGTLLVLVGLAKALA